MIMMQDEVINKEDFVMNENEDFDTITSNLSTETFSMFAKKLEKHTFEEIDITDLDAFANSASDQKGNEGGQVAQDDSNLDDESEKSQRSIGDFLRGNPRPYTPLSSMSIAKKRDRKAQEKRNLLSVESRKFFRQVAGESSLSDEDHIDEDLRQTKLPFGSKKDVKFERVDLF